LANFHHFLDHQVLLIVFLTKTGNIRGHKDKELMYNLRNPLKMSGPESPLQQGVQASQINLPLFIFSIHLIDLRQKQNIAARIFEQLNVALHGPRILRQVFRIIELSGVYENTADSDIAVSLNILKQGEVTLVKSPHRGNQAYALTVTSQF